MPGTPPNSVPSITRGSPAVCEQYWKLMAAKHSSLFLWSLSFPGLCQMDGYREEQWLGRMEFWIVLILVTCHGLELELSKSTCQGHLVDDSQDLLVVPCSPFT